jgi:hypothetical protein
MRSRGGSKYAGADSKAKTERDGQHLRAARSTTNNNISFSSIPLPNHRPHKSNMKLAVAFVAAVCAMTVFGLTIEVAPGVTRRITEDERWEL